MVLFCTSDRYFPIPWDNESHHSTTRFWFRLEDHARRYVDQAHSFLVSDVSVLSARLKFQMSLIQSASSGARRGVKLFVTDQTVILIHSILSLVKCGHMPNPVFQRESICWYPMPPSDPHDDPNSILTKIFIYSFMVSYITFMTSQLYEMISKL